MRVTYHTESVAMTKPTVDALMDDVRQALAVSLLRQVLAVVTAVRR